MLWFLAPPTVIKTRTYEIYQYIQALEPQFMLHYRDYIGCYTVGAFAGNPAPKTLQSDGEYQTALSRLCRDMENSPDILEMF